MANLDNASHSLPVIYRVEKRERGDNAFSPEMIIIFPTQVQSQFADCKVVIVPDKNSLRYAHLGTVMEKTREPSSSERRHMREFLISNNINPITRNSLAVARARENLLTSEVTNEAFKKMLRSFAKKKVVFTKQALEEELANQFHGKGTKVLADKLALMVFTGKIQYLPVTQGYIFDPSRLVAYRDRIKLEMRLRQEKGMKILWDKLPRCQSISGLDLDPESSYMLMTEVLVSLYVSRSVEFDLCEALSGIGRCFNQ